MQNFDDFFRHRWQAFPFLQGRDLETYVKDAIEAVESAQGGPISLTTPEGQTVALVLLGTSGSADLLPINDSPETLRVLSRYDWNGLVNHLIHQGRPLRGFGVSLSRHWEEPPSAFHCTNVQMEKELSPVSLCDGVCLELQSESEKSEMMAREIPNYASEQRRISPDLSEEEAMCRSRSTFEEAEAKELNHFLKIMHGKDYAGVLWLLERSPESFFIANVRIFDAFQGMGLGRAGMELAESFSLQRGAKKLALHVFGHNTRARRLYESLGYRTVGEYWKFFV